MRSTVSAVLYTVAASAPTATDDRNKRFIRGSRWINTSTNEEFVCTSNEPTAAVWSSTTSGGGGGSSVHTDTVDPTINDDITSPYTTGQIWVNTATDAVFICADNTDGAAVWIDVASGGGGSSAHVTTSAPTINDDSGDGYAIGQLWVNTADDTAYIATDVTVGAAVWKQIDGAGGGGGGSAQSTNNNEALALDVATSNIVQNALDGNVTQTFTHGAVYLGQDLTGLVADPGTTFVTNAGDYAAVLVPVEETTDSLLGLPTGAFSASSIYNTGYEAYKASDASDGSRWSSNYNVLPRWWKVDYGVGVTKCITRIMIKQYYDGSNLIGNFDLEGSNDDSNWTVIGSKTQANNSNAQTHTFTNTTLYRYYRINITSSGTGYSSIFQLEFFHSSAAANVTNPILTTSTITLPAEATKAVVAVIADIAAFTINSTFVLSVSNNGGTNYDTATLVDRGQRLPSAGSYKTYTAVVPLTDRNAQDMRIKIQCTGTQSVKIRGIGVEYIYAESGAGAGDIWATVPTTSTSTGVAGQLAYDASYIYICTAPNVWKRVAIGSW